MSLFHNVYRFRFNEIQAIAEFYNRADNKRSSYFARKFL